jgi:hypothetical protein
MSVELLMELKLAKETEYSEKACPSAIYSIGNTDLKTL